MPEKRENQYVMLKNTLSEALEKHGIHITQIEITITQDSRSQSLIYFITMNGEEYPPPMIP